MKGHIRERSPGHWAIISMCATRRLAKRSANGICSKGLSEKLRSSVHALFQKLAAVRNIEPAKTTVGQFLIAGLST